jgi:hypothetical protein
LHILVALLVFLTLNMWVPLILFVLVGLAGAVSIWPPLA